MKKLLFFVCLIMYWLPVLAMYNYPGMPQADVKRYITQRDWVGLAKAMEKEYVHPSYIAEYSKDILDQPYKSPKPSYFDDKNLFQICLQWAYVLRLDTHFNFLEALILGEKVTHSEVIANYALLPRALFEYTKVEVTLLMYYTLNPVEYYNKMIRGINTDKMKIEQFIKDHQIEKLAQYGRERLCDVVQFAPLSDNLKQELITYLSSQIVLPHISDETKQYLTALRDNLQPPQEPVESHHEAKSSRTNFSKIFVSYKTWVAIAACYLGVKCYQRVTSGRGKYTQNMLINETGSEITMTDDEGHEIKIASGQNNVTELSKTTGSLIVRFSDPDSTQVKIDLSRYEDSLDDYFINITIRPTRLYERLYIRTPLTYSLSWKQKPTQETK